MMARRWQASLNQVLRKSSGLREGTLRVLYFLDPSRRGGDDAIGGAGALECTQHGGGYLRAHARLGFVRGHVSLKPYLVALPTSSPNRAP